MLNFITHPLPPTSARSGLPHASSVTRRRQCSQHFISHRSLQACTDASSLNWRDFRARLVRSETASAHSQSTEASPIWAHSVPFLEPGTLLVASPEHFTAAHSCAFFARTLVLVLDHTPESTSGLILNRPIARSLPLLPKPPTLGLGGPVGLDQVVVLHRNTQLGRAVVGNVRVSPFSDVVRQVRDYDMDSDQCRFFCGYSGWTPGQLREEIDHGIWYTCAVSDNLIMRHFEHDSVAGVLRLMGGRFADIARLLDDRKPTS